MVLSIGEILVDIFLDGEKKTVFPGGAPFNVASNIAHFNGDVSFFGAIGNDEYGHQLIEFAQKRIKHLYLGVLSDRHTTEAIVTLLNGERSFRFNRDLGADYILDINKLSRIDFKDIKIAHIGSLMLSYLEGEKFFFEAIKYIKSHSHALISFDVNYRDDIFESEQQAKNIFLKAIKEADILKFTEEELELLTGHKNVLDGLKSLLSNKQVAVVTLGKEGSIFYSKDKYLKVSSFPLKPVDTTGAGDGFYSYFLYALDKGLDITNDEEIKSTLLRANVVGGLTTQKKGAIDAVPSLEEIEQFLKLKQS